MKHKVGVEAMAALIFKQAPSMQQRLTMMREDARYDVADDRTSDTQCVPDAAASTVSTRSVPKVFLSNDCKFNCAYCGCRQSNEGRMRYSHEPREMAQIAVREAIRNGRGVFVTSAVCQNPDYTEERIVETIRCMREELHYPGYIHAKVMPGTDPGLIALAGRYADRLSVNIEVAQSSGYSRLARQKNKGNILTPMRNISELIQAAKLDRRKFVQSQTTQLMAGSTGESDRTILVLSGALYAKYRLKRVYYTAFHYDQPAAGYDLAPVAVPAWRTRRLYQADRLMQMYGYRPEELVSEAQPNLPEHLDPKMDWALRNPQRFPVEINSADFETLLRVPGIGILYAQRILRARRYGALSHEALKALGVPMKRCIYFIQCNGRYQGGKLGERPDLLRTVFYEPTAPRAEQLSFL